MKKNQVSWSHWKNGLKRNWIDRKCVWETNDKHKNIEQFSEIKTNDKINKLWNDLIEWFQSANEQHYRWYQFVHLNYTENEPVKATITDHQRGSGHGTSTIPGNRFVSEVSRFSIRFPINDEINAPTSSRIHSSAHRFRNHPSAVNCFRWQKK